MFEWKNFEIHRNIFTEAGAGIYHERWGQHHIDLRPRDLLRWIELCRDDLGYLILVDIAAVDRRQMVARWNCQFELVYVLFNLGSHQHVHLHLHLNENETVPNIGGYYPHADWMEREQAEMLGINFHEPTAKLILTEKETIIPLRKDALLGKWVPHSPGELPRLKINPNKSEAPYPEESWVWKRFGSLSPVTMGNFEWLVCFDPVKVVSANATIGFHHRGMEKLVEGRPWNHILQLVDMFHSGSAPTYSTLWAKTLEEMLRIKLPERAQAIRIVFLELARIAEHLTVLHEITIQIKPEESRIFLNIREKVFELFEKYCGHRLGLGIVRLGGVREDLPHGWIAEYQSIAHSLQKGLITVHNSLLGQNNFSGHLDSAGVNAQTVLQWGVGGPAMRASGLNFDLRKSQPFYFYQDIDFDVPVGIHGTSYDRYLIRYEEIHQSLRIITQVLDNLPLGDVVNPGVLGNMDSLESLLQQLTNHWHFSSIEAPNGEAGFLLLCADNAVPYRMKVKSPSFTLAQALPEFVKGLSEDQLRAAVASLGIRKTELDR